MHSEISRLHDPTSDLIVCLLLPWPHVHEIKQRLATGEPLSKQAHPSTLTHLPVPNARCSQTFEVGVRADYDVCAVGVEAETFQILFDSDSELVRGFFASGFAPVEELLVELDWSDTLAEVLIGARERKGGDTYKVIVGISINQHQNERSTSLAEQISRLVWIR